MTKNEQIARVVAYVAFSFALLQKCRPLTGGEFDHVAQHARTLCAMQNYGTLEDAALTTEYHAALSDIGYDVPPWE